MNPKDFSFLKICKIDKLLIMNKERSHKPPNIRNERRDMSVDVTDIKCILRKYCKHFKVINFDKLGKMN